MPTAVVKQEHEQEGEERRSTFATPSGLTVLLVILLDHLEDDVDAQEVNKRFALAEGAMLEPSEVIEKYRTLKVRMELP